MIFEQKILNDVWDSIRHAFRFVVDSLPLPSGAATSDKQDALLAEVQKKTEPNDFQMTDTMILSKQLSLALMYPPWFDRSANAIRNQVQSGTVTTVATVTNLTNFGSMSADTTYRMQSLNTWAANCRSLIT